MAIHVVDDTLLQRDCLDAEFTVAALGIPLARYLLTARERNARLLRPRLPQHRGIAFGLFAMRLFVNHDERERRGLADAFLLPFQWRDGAGDARGLPGDVVRVAAQVREECGRRGWRLCWPDDLADYDLSGLTVQADSLWATLAAALEIAVAGGTPRADVFATGVWEPGVGMKGVESIRDKLDAVREAPGAENKTVFVPAANYHEAIEAAVPGVELLPYPVGESDWRKVLKEHLRRLDAPPRCVHAGLDRCIEWANQDHIMGSPKDREKFYLDELVGGLAERLRAGSQACRGIERLVLALSLQRTTPLLLSMAIRPGSLMLLGSAATGAVTDLLAGREITAEKIWNVDDSAPDEIVDGIAAWLRASPGHAAVDITGGTKEMTAMLVAAAGKAGATVVYLKHGFDEHNRIEYGREELRRLSWI